MTQGEKKVLTPEEQERERLKYEVADELGLLEKVQKEGWKALSARETGRIGGLMTKRRRAQQASLHTVDDNTL